MQLKLSKYFLFKIIESKNNFHNELWTRLVARTGDGEIENHYKMNSRK